MRVPPARCSGGLRDARRHLAHRRQRRLFALGAALMIFGVLVDTPDIIEFFASGDVAHRQHRGHHRMILVVIAVHAVAPDHRSEEHTSELQSLMRISYAVFCLKKKINKKINKTDKYNNIRKLKHTIKVKIYTNTINIYIIQSCNSTILTKKSE